MTTYPRRHPEYWAWMAGITAVCALGVGSSVSPTVEAIGGWVLAGLAVAVVGVAAVRRELRIHRRLTAIRPLTPEEAVARRPRISSPIDAEEAA